MERNFSRSKKLVLCNNKGGVGKSTLAFNLACGLAAKGFRTVLVDLDPQCNLTLLALGEAYFDEDSVQPRNSIYQVLKPKIEGRGDIDLGVKPSKVRENLSIVPGDLNLTLFEDLLGDAITNATAGQARGYSDTSAIDRYLNELGSTMLVDIFVIDTSPSLGALNRVILLGGEYFIVPLLPDSFSGQGGENLGTGFERWKKHWRNTAGAAAVSGEIAASHVLRGDALFLGYIINNFNVYRQKTVSRQAAWLEKIPQRVQTYLSNKHGRNGLVEISWKKPLGHIQDAGQLPAICHSKHLAISELTRSDTTDLNLVGTQELHQKLVAEMNSMVERILERLAAY
ncbi:MAG: AAA family ATPase [Alphaproteobacteria bacterium]|nr:AAA family ATPase [Alphaproteobacteria bacterium]